MDENLEERRDLISGYYSTLRGRTDLTCVAANLPDLSITCIYLLYPFIDPFPPHNPWIVCVLLFPL